MARRKTVKPTSPPVQDVGGELKKSEPVLPKEPEAKKPMNNIQRVKFMSALADAVEDAGIVAAFKNISHGDKILELFTNAVDDEIANLMGGEELATQLGSVGEVTETLRQTVIALSSFRGVIQALSRSPIIEVLHQLNRSSAPTYNSAANGPDVLHNEAIDESNIGGGRRNQPPGYVLP